ncbi:hypothetical protein QEG32_002095 [Stenotrophomonas maltophilia]|nr:hypothetical protein [Stenotrophomonas maltophilia]
MESPIASTIIAGLLLSTAIQASASPCTLSTLTIDASKNGIARAHIVSDLTKTTTFYEGSPYQFVSAAIVRVDSDGVKLDQEETTTSIDVGFRGITNCFGDRVLIDFSHTDLIGVQTIPLALIGTSSRPPILDSFRTTMILEGRSGSEPEHRTMNGWTYSFRAE